MGMLGFLILAGLYFLPTIIALLRSHNPLGVFLVNLLAGWTFFGWIAALVMACGSNGRPQQVVIIQAPAELGHAATPLPPGGESGYKGDATSWSEWAAKPAPPLVQHPERPAPRFSD